MAADTFDELESQIGHWRSYLRRRRAIAASDVEELEDHLRDQIQSLREKGLDGEEAFLVAVKRMGNLDALSREFAREHSDRLWKQLVLSNADDQSGEWIPTDLAAAIGLAIASAVAIKIPELFGVSINDGNATFYARNLPFFVLPFLCLYFFWKRRIAVTVLPLLVVPFLLTAILVNVYPFTTEGATEGLTMLHLPIFLWLVVGIAYTGGNWRSGSARMDFIRFSGELFIYYVLIALGGGVLMAFTLGMFSVLGFDLEWLLENWILPCGAMGAVIVGSWLVEAKQSVVENMAPVLTRMFSPLFTIMLFAFLVTMIVTGRGIDVDREVLIGFDLLLVLVLGLSLYAISARDPDAAPNWFDALQLALLLSALLIDIVALTAISIRISDFGFSANKVAALGENIVLLVSLAWTAWLYVRFLSGRGGFAALERWQTDYLPVYALWALIVVVVFPPVFGFV